MHHEDRDAPVDDASIEAEAFIAIRRVRGRLQHDMRWTGKDGHEPATSKGVDESRSEFPDAIQSPPVIIAARRIARGCADVTIHPPARRNRAPVLGMSLLPRVLPACALQRRCAVWNTRVDVHRDGLGDFGIQSAGGHRSAMETACYLAEYRLRCAADQDVLLEEAADAVAPATSTRS